MVEKNRFTPRLGVEQVLRNNVSYVVITLDQGLVATLQSHAYTVSAILFIFGVAMCECYPQRFYGS